jgi:hypothetical protein
MKMDGVCEAVGMLGWLLDDVDGRKERTYSLSPQSSYHQPSESF